GHRPRPTRKRDANVQRSVADDHGIGGVRAQTAEAFHGRQRDLKKSVSIVHRVSEGAARKVPPQIEVLEFDPRAFLEIPGQQSEKYVVAPGERVEQLTHTRHDALPWAGLQEFHSQVFEIESFESGEGFGRYAVSRSRLRENPGVCPAVERHAPERVRNS